MSQHHDPVKPSLILDDFTRDEMLFGVAQMGSLKKGGKKLAIGEAAADDGPKLRLVNCHSCNTEKISNSVGNANGNRTLILALKGLRANRCTIAPPMFQCRTHIRIRKIPGMHKRLRPRTHFRVRRRRAPLAA